MLKLVWDFKKYTGHFWIYAQFSMTPFLCQLPLPSAPPHYHICLINWSEILAAKTNPGGSIGIYCPWTGSWDPETRTISTYPGTEMWPEEYFKGYILTACVQWSNKKPASSQHGKMCRHAGRVIRKKSAAWFLIIGGATTNFSQIFQPSFNKFPIRKIIKLAWAGFWNSQPDEIWVIME